MRSSCSGLSRGSGGFSGTGAGAGLGAAADARPLRYHLRVVYGLFGSKDAALEGARRLPPKYQNAFQMEVRSLAEIRAAI